MAKKQTRRSISVSRTTYERLKAFCETNHVSMSQLVETRVNDFLGPSDAPVTMTMSPAPMRPVAPVAPRAMSNPPAFKPIDRTGSFDRAGAASESRPAPGSSSGSSGSAPVAARPAATQPQAASTPPAPMTSAAARFAVEPPPPIIKPRQETAAPKPAEKRPEQIFTF